MATAQVTIMTEGERHIATIRSREDLYCEELAIYDVTCKGVYGEGGLRFSLGALGRALNAAVASEDSEATTYVLNYAERSPSLFGRALEEARAQRLVSNIN